MCLLLLRRFWGKKKEKPNGDDGFEVLISQRLSASDRESASPHDAQTLRRKMKYRAAGGRKRNLEVASLFVAIKELLAVRRLTLLPLSSENKHCGCADFTAALSLPLEPHLPAGVSGFHILRPDSQRETCFWSLLNIMKFY